MIANLVPDRRSAGRLLAPALLAGSLVAAACSGGGGGAGGGGFSDYGGDGTGTLKVVASVSVEDGDLDSVNVALTDANNSAVSGATVTLTTPEGEVQLVEQTVGLGFYELPSGTYAYAPGYRLDVERIDDAATNVTIAAPDLTQVTQPESQGAVFQNQPAEVLWDGEGADQHRLELTLNDFDSGWVDGDPGSYVIQGMFLTTAGTETLTVRRRKTMPITAGRPGSEFRIDLVDTVVPIAVQ